MLNVTRKTLLLLTVSVFALGLAGCDDDDDNNPTTLPTGGLGEGAMLRVVHASPGAPAVDIYAEGVAQPLVTDVEYLETTPYLDLAPGDYNIQLRAAGAPATSAPAFETGNLTIPMDAVITAVAAGKLGSMDADDMFRVIPLVEGFESSATQARVRVLHAGADAPAVDIDVFNDETVDVPAAAFGRFVDTGAAGVALPSGQALAIGIWAGGSRVTQFTTPMLGNDEYFLIATGLLAEKADAELGFGLLAVGPDGTIGLVRQDPVVYVLHASPDAPPVDVFVGGSDAELVDNLSFGNISPPVQVPPAAYTLDVREWDNGGTAATVTTPALVAGERYLAVASGFVGDTPSFALLPYGEDFGAPGTSLVRVVHASPDAPPVDVGAWDGTTFTAVGPFSGLAFGDASSGAGTELGTGALTVGVAQAGLTTPVATFDLNLTSGLAAYAVASGSLTEKGQSFRLLVVDTTASPWQVATVLPN
jgi:hypothetical protein